MQQNNQSICDQTGGVTNHREVSYLPFTIIKQAESDETLLIHSVYQDEIIGFTVSSHD